jgi:hypothetical protein
MTIQFFQNGSDVVAVETGMPSHQIRVGVGNTAAEAIESLEGTALQSAGNSAIDALNWCAGAGWWSHDDVEEMVEIDEDGDEVADFAITPEQDAQILAIDFGEIEDYYSDDDEIEAKREAWDSASDSWDTAVADLRVSTSTKETKQHLATMSRIEDDWGDDPATQRIRQILGL